MPKKSKILIIIISAVILLSAVFIPKLQTHCELVLYDREREKEVLSVPVKPGDKLSLEIEHSFEHIPWFEFYTITDDLQFNLDSIEVAGYGAGIPAEMDVPTKIEDGMVKMEDINSIFPEFRWITSDKYMKEFKLNGEVIFDFRSLPDASKIKGYITTKRG